MSFVALIEQLAHQPSVRGRQFERLSLWYLQNAPEYRHRLKKVWLWKEWPGRWGPDAGIDLVAETIEGDLWAIQAKAEENISKREIDSFLSESNRPTFVYRLLMATTDNLSSNAHRTIVGQEKPVGLALRSHLEASDVDWPPNLETLAPSRRAPAERRDHQREAIRDILAGFDESDRGQLIMACGTGKTLVALWIAEDLNSNSTLILVPSLTLLSQTLREWTANASEPFDYLAVCSDQTVADRDAMLSSTADLGLPVTTNPAAIKSFLDRDSRRVIFATYQSSPRIAEACTRGAPPFDLAVADEAHRCTGPTTSDFTTVLDEDQIRIRRRLFMTATPRYFTGRIRKAAAEADLEIASMDDEEKFGPILHTLTFGEAIERDLLSDYIVFVVGVDEDTYHRYLEQGELVTTDGDHVKDARNLARHIGLAKAIRKQDLRRVISFHGRVKKAQSFSSAFPDIVRWMPADDRPEGEIWATYISGEMPAGKRDVLLRRFRNTAPGSRSLLSNARCLAEGVDVPAIDGITFIDPKGSTIDIIQAVGRAIRKSPEKRVGVVVLPVFVTDDDDPEVVLQDSSFKTVWQVLDALRAHDDMLAEELDGLRRRLGRERGYITRPTKIVVDLPIKVSPTFARAFDIRLVEQTTASWELLFGLLERFVEREGHASVPRHHTESGLKLGSWISNQKQVQRTGGLSEERRRMLEAIAGWDWELLEAAWQEGLAKVRLFVEREGHANVPRHHTESGLALGSWVSTQRQRRQTGRLSEERRRTLEVIPAWDWKPFEGVWQEGLAKLRQFVEREGHANVPGLHSEGGFRLGSWVNTQRQKWRMGTLTKERRRMLEAIAGWDWEPIEAVWQEGLAKLRQFVEREGHASVPQLHREGGFKLGSWVSDQRRGRRTGRLSEERRRMLEAIAGWDWEPLEAAWQEGLAKLRQFVEREGHASVPQRHTEGGLKLGAWVQSQRHMWRTGRLSEERRRTLEVIPAWDWKPGRHRPAGHRRPGRDQ